MRLELILPALCLAPVLFAALGWKWRVDMLTCVLGGLVIGVLAGLLTALVDLHLVRLGVAAAILVELCFIGIMAVAAVALRFYRDPERLPRETRNVILAPADGKVIYASKVDGASSLVSTKGGREFKLTEIAATDMLGGGGYLIGIEMNLLNVHVNRSPISGTVLFQKRTRGRFMSLGRPEAEAANERVTTVVASGQMRVGVVQIASRLVRGIASYVHEGDSLAIGQRLGMIRFGSQVDVVIPETNGLKIVVKPNERVTAGITVLARYNQTAHE
jgi:phosphatidylserine decarboxylase